MNHNVTLAIVAVVAAMTLTAVAFAIPQQALAYRHHSNHNNHNNHNNSIKVDQQINQLNSCTGDNGQQDQQQGKQRKAQVAVAVAVQYALTQATIQPTYTNNLEWK